ncbi:hypothetical protein N0V83_007297 [Neocucurbitaria cava]|uniref:Uncharacterized protein n=1 Tax=Neocucurbitaria cava TaxID=798079 RepID=A0A9W9CK58_9PLEO|nr:hypothetical protein N0V83_007297 [Neocucurbitaria cava]
MANTIKQGHNAPYEQLKRELGDDAALLKYLPYPHATFEEQTEHGGAVPERLLFGDMRETRGTLWAYYTMLVEGTTPTVAFHTIRGAKQHMHPIHPSRATFYATPSFPFKYAEDHDQIVAIVHYFFIRRGADDHLNHPISAQPFKDDLLRACRHYEAVHKQIHAREAAQTSGGPAYGSMERVRQWIVNCDVLTRKAADQPGGSVHGSTSHSARAPSYALSSGFHRKRQHSPDQYYKEEEEPGHLAPYSQSTTLREMTPDRPITARDALVTQYIALQDREDELNSRIQQVEVDKTNIEDTMAELQADLNAANDRMYDLEIEKGRLRDEKKQLQGFAEVFDDQVELGLAVGREMERKRLRRE